MQRIDPDKYVYDKVEPAVIDVNGETQETYLIYDVVTNQPPPQVGKNFVFVLLNRIHTMNICLRSKLAGTHMI